MLSFCVNLQVFEEFDAFVSAQRLRQIAEKVLAVEGSRCEAEVGVIVAGDDVLRSLNKQHRGVDENADVLSFSFSHHGEYHGESERRFETSEGVSFVLPPGQKLSLGEVVISYPQARRQADQAGHTVGVELAVLLVHGILHLLGYDHEEPEEAGVMQKMESHVRELI